MTLANGHHSVQFPPPHALAPGDEYSGATVLWGVKAGVIHFMAKRRIRGRHVSPATLLPALCTNR